MFLKNFRVILQMICNFSSLKEVNEVDENKQETSYEILIV